jgi:hypothetical protein
VPADAQVEAPTAEPAEVPAEVIEPSPSVPVTPTAGARAATLQVTARVPPGAAAPQLFMELYRGPEPGQWTATSGSEQAPRRSFTLDIPEEAADTWLIRVDSRPPMKGPYSIALHPAGSVPAARFDAPAADAFEADDSWFQATPLRLGEAQAHTMGDSANPRGDEDWFVIAPGAKSP